MDYQRAIEFINSRKLKVKQKPLTELERLLAQGMWTNEKYADIAQSSSQNYKESYLGRDASRQFLDLVREIFDSPTKLKKRSFQKFITSKFRDEEPESSSLLVKTVALAKDIKLKKYRVVFVYGSETGEGSVLVDELEDFLSRSFDSTYQMSLIKCATPTQCLLKALNGFQVQSLPDEKSFDQLLQHVQILFKQQSCLLILKDADVTYQRGTLASKYLPEFASYQFFLDQVVRDDNNGCIIWVSYNPPVQINHISSPYIYTKHFGGVSSKEDIEKIAPNAQRVEGSPTEWNTFLKYFNGDPSLIRHAVQDVVYNQRGYLTQYLQEPLILSQQMYHYYDYWIQEWLSNGELALLRWFALGKPLSRQDLHRNFRGQAQGEHLEEILASLKVRSLYYLNEDGDYCISKSLAAYISKNLVDQLFNELLEGPPDVLHDIALRQGHVLHDLVSRLRHFSRQDCIARLRTRLQQVKQAAHQTRSYAASNLLKIATALNMELHEFDLSKTYLRHIDFRCINLQQANFSQCQFEECSFSLPIEQVNSVAFSPDNRWLASGDLDGRILIWNPHQGELIRIYHNYDYDSRTRVGVQEIDFQNDNTLVVFGEDGFIRYWDISKSVKNPYRVISLDKSNDTKLVKFSYNCEQISLVTENNKIKIWNIAANQYQCVETSLSDEDDEIIDLITDIDNKFLIVCSEYNLYLWRITKEKAYQISMWKSTGIISSVHFQGNAESDVVIVAESKDNIIYVHQLDISQEYQIKRIDIQRYQLPKDIKSESIVYNPNVQCLASFNSNQTIRWWNSSEDGVISGEQITLETGFSTPILRWSLAHDGHTIVAVGQDQLKFWSLRQNIREARGFWNRVACFAVDNQVQILATGHEDGSLRIWQGKTGRYIHCVENFGRQIQCLTFSPCGAKLAVGDDKGRLCILNLEKGIHEMDQLLDPSTIHRLQFSPDGQLLATINSNSGIKSELKIWSVGKQSNNNNYPIQVILPKATRSIKCMSFVPNENQLVYGGAYGNLSRWDLSSEKEELLSSNIGSIEQLQVRNDGSSVLVSTRDKIYLFQFASSTLTAIPIPEGGNILAASFDQGGHVAIAYVADPTQHKVKIHYTNSNIPDLVEFPRSIKTATFISDCKYLIGYQSTKRLFIWCREQNKVVSINAYYPYVGLNIAGCSSLLPQDRLHLEEAERRI